MKKIFSSFILLTFIAGLFLVQPAGLGYAQGTTPPTATPYPGESDFITFEMLGLQDEVMVGPYANNYIRFSTPDSWSLQPGAKIVLDLETTVRSSRALPDSISEYSGALLEITLNDHVIDTLFLKTGRQAQLELTIPELALQTTRPDGRHTLQIYLNANIDCLFDHETAVLVRNVSGFSLPHTDATLTPSLALLPRPIYKPDSLLPEEAVLLLPDAPSGAELQSAMTVAATLGRMTAGEQIISVATTSTLSQAQKDNAHIIMVGKPSSLPLLNDVNFLVNNTAQEAEGVVHMAVSPWNASRAVLFIGGGIDEAVSLAAEAFSSGSLRTGKHYSLSIISSVAEAVEIKDVAVDRTLASLGYLSNTLTGVGYTSIEYNFLVPLGKTASEDPYFDLTYTHSAVFDYDASGAVIFLNDEPLGGIRFSEETANKVNTLRIHIPTYAIRSGQNVLSLQAEFIPSDYCSTLNDSSLWMAINQDSLLHIPLIDATESVANFTNDLSLYPEPFVDSPSLAETSFIMPRSDVESWDVGANLAVSLGQYAVGKTLKLKAFYADDLPEDVYDNHIILIGRASQLPVIADLAPNMPTSFEPGSDMAIENNALVSYSIPEGTDLGYLEMFTAPTNSSSSVLAVMGSTPLGLTWAENALLAPELREFVMGDYVVVHADSIHAVDTRAGEGTQNLSATAMPAEIFPTLIPDSAPVTSNAYQQDWVVVAIMATTGGIVLLLLILLVRSLFNRKSSKQ